METLLSPFGKVGPVWAPRRAPILHLCTDVGTPLGAVPAPWGFSPPARAWAQPCAPVCACVCTCAHACTHVYACTRVYPHVHVSLCVHVSVYTHVPVHVRACRCVHVLRRHVFMCACVCMCVCTLCGLLLHTLPTHTGGALRHTWEPTPLHSLHLFQVKATGLVGSATLSPVLLEGLFCMLPKKVSATQRCPALGTAPLIHNLVPPLMPRPRAIQDFHSALKCFVK